MTVKVLRSIYGEKPMVLHEQLRRSAQEGQKVDLINILIFSQGSLFENTLSFEKSTHPTSDHFVNKIEENLVVGLPKIFGSIRAKPYCAA